MKRKYLLGTLIFLSLISIGTPMVAGNGYILGVSADQTFIWEITELDSTGLTAALGGTWSSDIQSYTGTDGNDYGAKKKIVIVSTGTLLGNHRVDWNQWNWVTGSFAADPDGLGFYTSIPDDPINASGDAYQIFYPLSVRQFLAAVDHDPGYTAVGNVIVKIDDSNPQEIVCRWTISEFYGVIELFQMINVDNEVICEYRLISAPAPPFDLLGFLLMPAIFVGIGIAIFTVGIVIGKRR